VDRSEARRVLVPHRLATWVQPSARHPWHVWAATRVLALALGGLAVLMVRGNVFFDTSYYAGWAHGTLTGTRVPYRDFAWEYPPGALPAMLLPGLFAPLVGTPLPDAFYALYGVLWVGFMLLVDAAVARWLMVRAGRSVDHPALTLWLYGLPLLGALSWTRYDLLPAGASLMAVSTAGFGLARRSGALAGTGAALKMWPAVLAPVQRTRRAAVVASGAAVAVFALVAAVTLALTGSTGFGQVLQYQGRRGLQIESVVALPLVWLAHLHIGGYSHTFRFGAYEVTGPGTILLAHAVTGLYALGLVLLGLTHWRFMRHGASGRLVALTSVSVLLLTIVTNKVFSPQYVLWFLGVLAAACVLDPETWRPYVPRTLLVCVLTSIAFPWFYGDVLGTGWFGLVVLTVRDLLLLSLAVDVGRRVLVELQGLRRPRAPARDLNRA
jgi:hypothetical protein